MKEINEYTYTCPDCGKVARIKSNQPAGGKEPYLCSCFSAIILSLPKTVTGKHLYKGREETFKLQCDIINVIRDIAETMTVRQIYYRLVSTGYPKTEDFYSRVQRTLLDMRERGTLPYGLIADNTRSFYKPETYRSLDSMLAEQQRYYRRDFWQDQDIHVEIWLEKEALRSVFTDVTNEFQIPLYVAKGFSSVSFVYAAAEEIKLIDKPTFIYMFSDHDPSGVMVAQAIERRMRDFGVKAEFIRPCLTPDQIDEYSVTTRPTKQSNHSKQFRGASAELDALHPRILKQIIRNCIEQHIDADAYARLKGIEEAEKSTLMNIRNNLRHAS